MESLEPYKCVMVMTDPIYADLFEKVWFRRFGMVISFLMV